MLLAGFLGFALGFALALAVRFRRVRDNADNRIADDRVEDDPLVLERLLRYCQAI